MKVFYRASSEKHRGTKACTLPYKYTVVRNGQKEGYHLTFSPLHDTVPGIFGGKTHLVRLQSRRPNQRRTDFRVLFSKDLMATQTPADCAVLVLLGRLTRTMNTPNKDDISAVFRFPEWNYSFLSLITHPNTTFGFYDSSMLPLIMQFSFDFISSKRRKRLLKHTHT